MTTRHLSRPAALVALAALAVFGFGTFRTERPAAAQPRQAAADYAAVHGLLTKYCLGCHSTKAKKGSLDLERFATPDDVRKDLKVWQGVIEQVEAGEMPPKEKPQPTAE